jgi:OPA family sugar phosphate sensor protein UhpC-like MFS transporter
VQRTILKIPAIWVLALSSASIYVTRYAINSWGVLYLQEAKGYSLMQAGSVISVNTVAGILGAVAFGFMSDKLFNARRPPTNVIFAVLEIVGLLMVFYGPPGRPGFMTAAFFIYGFGLTGLVTSLGGLFALDIAPKRAAGAAMGFIGVFSYIGAALQDQISGHLIERGVTVIDGVRHYDFTAVIWFWVGMSVVSLILATSLWRVKVRD